ncbi:MAG: hypothetical protein QM727_14535 [Niabella sp.]
MTDNKVIKQKFKSSIRRGTGEAHFIMQQNPNIDFSTDIIKASLTNYAYDGQSEGSRALYISELISFSKQQDKIHNAILQGLTDEQKDTWALVQLFDLAAFFAKQGNKKARQAIYKRFFKKIINGSDWCGYASIIRLDGLEGLKYIATTIGKFLEKSPDNWQDSSIIQHFQKDYPNIKAQEELEKASKENPFIKIYLDNIKQTEDGRKDYKKPVVVINYETITERINNKARRFPINPFEAKRIKKADIKKLANDFLKETDRIKLEKYMKVFDRVKYPYDYSPILEIVKGKNHKNDRLVEFAAGALKYFSGNDIRKFAIECLSTTKNLSDYLDLLVSNYKKGDYKLLTTIANNCKSEDTIHSIVYGYINIYRANKTKECKEPLEAVYEKLTCGIHRKDIVKILIDNKVLSKQIKDEIKYDSFEEVRQLNFKK